MEDENRIEMEAQENFEEWQEVMDMVSEACEQTGITLKLGMCFLDNLYKASINDLTYK